MINTGEINAGANHGTHRRFGWGNLPYFSEFSPSGRLVFNAELPTGVNSYRAYRLPWPGR